MFELGDLLHRQCRYGMSGMTTIKLFYLTVDMWIRECREYERTINRKRADRGISAFSYPARFLALLPGHMLRLLNMHFQSIL